MDADSVVQLRDAEVYPTDGVLKAILRDSYGVYQALLELYKANDLEYEWRFYNDAKIWLCKVRQKKRTIVWMSVWNGYIQATIYFPERYIDDIYGLDISEGTIESIKNTKNTGKSKPCVFKMVHTKTLADFTSVMQFKLQSK